MGVVVKASFVAAALPYLVAATTYNLQDSFEGTNLYSGFNFETDPDKSGGWVTYVDQATAQSGGLTIDNGQGAARIGVDHSSTLSSSGAGRNAIRLSSKTAYDKGLFIFDASHMPGGICGVWPAWWMLGDGASGDWPKTGEWDILENVNNNKQNQLTAHTNAGCGNSGAGASGTVLQSNCNDNNGFNGCGTLDEDTNSWGNGLNNAGGGVWATEWTESHIATWFFPRNSIPSDITNKSPNPQNWGQPKAMISNSNGCDINTYFPDPMRMTLNTDFCGDWAQGQWSQSCQAITGQSSCKEYVAAHPDDFQAAYWDVNYVRVYQAEGGAPAAQAQAVEMNGSSSAVPEVNDSRMGGPGYKGGPDEL